MTPVVITGVLVYLPLLVLSYIGERAERASEILYDASWRKRYIKWCEDKSNYKDDV